MSSFLRAQKALGSAHLLRRAAAEHDASLRDVYRRAMLVRRHGFALADAASLGLLDPRLPAAELARFTSTRHLQAELARVNPKELFWLTEDKAVFQRLGGLMGLPLPRLFALYHRDATGWGHDGSMLCTRADWCAFVERALPDELVVKPARGVKGLGFELLRRDGDELVSTSGRRYTAGGLVDRLEGDREYDSFLFQERLRNHAELERLTESGALLTVRIMSWVDRAGSVSIPDAVGLKVTLGDAVTDNIGDGDRGNALCPVDLQGGTLGPAVIASVELLGCRSFERHPRTGIAFAEVRLPFWAETIELAKGAARLLLPLRSIGWDIAITPTGPVIVEANVGWASANDIAVMPAVMEQLREDV